MNEACENFLGCGLGTEKGCAFAKGILDYMRSRLLDFQKETGNYYNLEATPAEGASYRLARIEKRNVTGSSLQTVATAIPGLGTTCTTRTQPSCRSTTRGHV
jgi:ribonucleoside-triphosphate reductase